MGRIVGKVGWIKPDHYPNGVPVALVAAVNEFGWPEHNIPPRLGMRATAHACEAAWRGVSQIVAGKLAKGTLTPAQAMEIITAKAAGDVRAHIAGPISPPLKVDTVKARLRRMGIKPGRTAAISITAAHPLTDTRVLFGHLTNGVEAKV